MYWMNKWIYKGDEFKIVEILLLEYVVLEVLNILKFCINIIFY